jgi:cell shape-determining protein MreC
MYHKKDNVIFNIFLLGALKGGKEVVQSGLKKVFPCHVLGATISSTPEQEKYEGKKKVQYFSPFFTIRNFVPASFTLSLR